MFDNILIERVVYVMASLALFSQEPIQPKAEAGSNNIQLEGRPRIIAGVTKFHE